MERVLKCITEKEEREMLCKNIRGMGQRETKESWRQRKRKRVGKKERQGGEKREKEFMRELLFTEAEHRQKGKDNRLSATLKTTRVNMFYAQKYSAF